MGPGVLSKLLETITPLHDENLLVGFDTSDDALVYKINETLVLVQTVDFFTPVVDDPFIFGQIAAANAMSDIYAMGADPKIAMNLLCVPNCLPEEMTRAILAGGHDRIAAAGAILAGGHTIEDHEPKYGLCVSGFAHPDDIVTNANAQAGDVLLLTKPLGSGIITTAIKADLASENETRQAVEQMVMLNKQAKEAASRVGVHACTDVTGFGFLGHAYEMAKASGVSLSFNADALPILPGVLDYARMGIIPGGAYRNMDYLQEHLQFDGGVLQEFRDVMSDPQTSGGLLLSLEKTKAAALLSLLQDFTPWAKVVGEVLPKKEQAIYVSTH